MITLSLTDDDVQALAGLMDAGVRATGLRSVKDAAALLEKIEQAQQESERIERHAAMTAAQDGVSEIGAT